jgi:hypothetical protein
MEEKRKKEEIIKEPVNTIGLQTKAIYKINFEAVKM